MGICEEWGDGWVCQYDPEIVFCEYGCGNSGCEGNPCPAGSCQPGEECQDGECVPTCLPPRMNCGERACGNGHDCSNDWSCQAFYRHPDSIGVCVDGSDSDGGCRELICGGVELHACQQGLTCIGLFEQENSIGFCAVGCETAAGGSIRAGYSPGSHRNLYQRAIKRPGGCHSNTER